ALLGAVLVPLSRLRVGPVWVGAAWVLEEALRDRVPFGGFPWGRLAFSQAESPLRWFAALGGAPLVTFVVAVAGAGLAEAVHAGWPGHDYRRVGVGLAVAVLVPVLGGVLSAPLSPAPYDSGRTLTVAVIQGGLPDLGLQFETRPRQVLDNHVAQTLKLAAEVKAGKVKRPDLVLWPENSSDIDPYRDPSVRAEIDGAVKAIGAPVLVGAILQNDSYTQRSNVGILWSPTTGPGATYTKRHPVPFAEYIPLRGLAQLVSSDAKTVEDMVSGSGNGLLLGGPAPIGDVICFEVAYDGLVRSSVAAGAQLLVVQTNNATFGHTAETYQQLAMAQLRAVETGRTVVQAATTGKSAVIGPDGGIRDESGPLYSSDILVDTVPLRTGLTLATRVGAWPEYLLSALAAAGVIGVVVTQRRGRRSTVEEPPPAESAAEEMVKA
ncbi:MAG: apolipoprotein N-acyltransferase, partial [Actinobacteria bacterium]|nr:apolipoprotein N-acyltransferase [Actinomycetota bacterium]